MSNLYRRFIALLPQRPPLVGDVTAYAEGVATITLPSGGIVRAKGVAQVGDRVFARDGVIEGPAPNLPVVSIEV